MQLTHSERPTIVSGLRRRGWLLGRVGLGVVLVLGLFGASPAAARHGHRAVATDEAYTAPVFEWILLNADTGQVLGEQNADVLTYPASLTKMMTLYLTFEALNQGRIRLDQQLSVSADAASKAPSKLGLNPGETVSVHDLILGIVTKSANDAATVLAEGLAGSEANFARYMTWKARQLGMDHTWYQNASGLPNPDQRTTARDVARLALALYHQFPREYRYFATREFEFHGEPIHGHNHLLDRYPGADGIKTGFINASGFNLAASAVRDGHRLIGVVMGGRTWRSRDEQMASLLDQGFARVVGHPAPSQPAATAVAAAAPASALASSAPAAVAATASAAAPAVTNVPAAARQPARDLGTVASAALRHLSPVGKAEAAPLAREVADADWAIQLGAFHDKAAAQRAARHAAALALAHGKPEQILAPGRHDSSRLYRARLLHFTGSGARAACAELHRRGIACSVVQPTV